ncbi:MAG TPA: hypothetical protein VNX88_13650 [Terriglobales bacterium]|jgi:hypothetical protein|nr:hypothetical protein [Terriglobales bacterium]
MKSLTILIAAAALCVPAVSAQDQPPGSSGRSSAAAENNQQDSQHTQDNKAQPKERQKKKGKKTDDDVPNSPTFSDAVAQNLLQKLADGLEGHSDRQMLSVLDADNMEGYLTFQQQIGALFQRYDSFRVHFRILQISSEGSKGVALVDFEMEEIPRVTDEQPVRKRNQLRFEMERGNKGWKIVDVHPRSFFTE